VKATEIGDSLSALGDSVEMFKRDHDRKHDRLQNRVEHLERSQATAGIIGSRAKHKARKAFDNFARTGDDAEMKAMSIAGGAAAGEALVPEVIRDQITDKALAQSPIAQAVRRTRVSTSDYAHLVNLRGQAAAWSAEAGTRSEGASTQFREIRPTHGELYAVVGVTRWLLQDSQFDVADLIMRNAADQFSKSIEAAIISGSGSNRPTGLLNTDPNTIGDDDSPQRTQDILQYVSGTADLADDLITLFFTLKNEYRSNAAFAMSSTTLAAIRKLRDSSGSGYLWQQNLAQGMDAPDGLLLGKNVITTEELGASGQSPSNFSILCGDFVQGYELIEIGPMAIVRDEVTDRGRVLFYISQRFGGRIVDNDAVKVLQA